MHDRDRVYGPDFATRIAALGIESVRTPVRAPRANATAERVVRSLRERHVRAVLAEFVSYYNQDRPHRFSSFVGGSPRTWGDRKSGGDRELRLSVIQVDSHEE